MAVVFVPVISRCQILNALRSDWTLGLGILEDLARRRALSAAERLHPVAILSLLSELKERELIEERIDPDSSSDPGRVPLASRQFRLTPAGETLKKELCPEDYSGCCS